VNIENRDRIDSKLLMLEDQKDDIALTVRIKGGCYDGVIAVVVTS
jgi:hypothetical protein